LKTVIFQSFLPISTQNGKELLTQVIDPLGRATWYDYLLNPAQFNLVGTTPITSNPYALLSDVIYPTGGKTVYTYKPAITRYVGSNAVNQTYQIDSREDRSYYSDGTYTAYNHKGFTYSGDMGSSYNQTITFTTAIDNGLTSAVFTNQKDSSDTTIPPTYYNMNVTTTDKGNTEKRSTTYSFDTARHWYWPITTSSVTTNMLNNTSGLTITTSRSFDDYANVTLDVDPMGTRTSYNYAGMTHLLANVSQQISSTQTRYTEYQRNTQGTVTQTTVKDTDTNGTIRNQTKYGIDVYGNAMTITFCKTVTCDSAGSIIKSIEYNTTYQSAFPTKTTVTTYDADNLATTVVKQYAFDMTTGKLTSVTDGLNYVSSFQYDAIGRVTKATHNIDNTSVSIQYDDYNNNLTTKDETGITALRKWNPLGLTTESGIVDAVGYKAKSKSGYDIYGRLSWAEDAIGNHTSQQYDAWNRETSITYPDSYSASTVYDDVNLTKTMKDPENYSIKATMDKLNRIIQQDEIKATGATTTLTTTTYNYVGDVLTAKDAKNNVTTYQYDQLSRLTGVINAKNETIGYAYDMLNDLTTTTFPDGKSKSTQYDELGRIIKTTDANSKIEKMYYDANGNLTKLIDRNNVTFTYQYTNRNFLWKKNAPDETITFGYDNTGRRTSMADVTGTTGYTYDPFTGQLRTMTYPDGKTIQYDYDANGNRQQMSDPFGTNVYYSYDARNRLKTVGQAASIISGTRTIDSDATYSYYNNNLLKTISQKNGVTSNYTYDGIKLDTLVEKKADNTVLNSFDYNYDNNKNINQIIQTGAIAQTLNYTYDPLNRISTSDQGNQTYTYDNRGNRSVLTSINPANSPDASYSYDKRDRLTSVTVDGKAVTYKYNGDGLLWERTESGQTTRYYCDGADVIAEATVSGGVAALKARYIRGSRLIARQGADNDKQYYLQNGHGDVIELRDSTGNTRLNQYMYDMWGNPMTSNETVTQPFRYSGELWDNTSKLQYLRARWYDPSMGRFMTKDTYEGQIDNPLSLNLYSYGGNNPLINIDPSGHDFHPDWGQYDYLYNLAQGDDGDAVWAQNQLNDRHNFGWFDEELSSPSSTTDTTSSFTTSESSPSTSNSVTPTSSDEKRQAVLTLAQSLVGQIPYLLPPDTGTVNYNTNGIPSNQDCSAFTSSLYLTSLDVKIGRTTRDQINVGTSVEVGGDYQIGDLIFTDGGGHVGIYAGDGILLHEGPASKSTAGNVKLTPLIYMDVTAVRRIIQNDGTVIIK
jgi:RHS repeat-associated protein